MADIHIPDKAYEEGFLDDANEHASEREVRAIIDAAAPLIVAADYEQFVGKLRETLHKLPEYKHGSLAWRVMNDIDAHITELRGGS